MMIQSEVCCLKLANKHLCNTIVSDVLLTGTDSDSWGGGGGGGASSVIDLWNK